MTSDLTAAIRRYGPEKRRRPLEHRPIEALATVSVFGPERPIFVPDTNVYIFDMAGRLPPQVATVLNRALVVHCSVALSEVAVGVGASDPSRPEWREVYRRYASMFAIIPPGRILVPDAQVWTEAGVIAGMLARTQNWQPHQRKAALNDVLIYLTAAKAGYPVLTADRGDFDLIQQVAPHGRFIHF